MTDRQKPLHAFPAIERYIATLLAVGCTLAIRLVFDPILGGGAPYLFFVLTIVIAKRLWGRGPALLATLLGGIATWYFILEPRFSFAVANRADTLNLACYFAVGAGISFMGEVSWRLPSSISVGGRSIKRRAVRQITVLAVAAVVLAGMALLLERNFKRSQEAQDWVTHTYQVIDTAESLRYTTDDAASSERRFVETSDARELLAYHEAVAAVPHILAELRLMTIDNLRQQARCIEIERLTNQRLALYKRVLEVRANQGADAAKDLFLSSEHLGVMDRQHSELRDTVEAERRLLGERTANAAIRDTREHWVLGLGSAAMILLLVLASVVIERETARREVLNRALSRHAGLLEQAHDSLITWPVGGGIDFWNRGSEILYGYTREEALGRVSHELLQTSRPPLGMAHIDAILQHDGDWQGEVTQTTKDGRKIIVEGRWTVAVDADGKKAVLEANRDITDKKLADEAMRESEAYFRSLFENMLNGYAYCRMLYQQDKPYDFTYLSVNNAFEVLTGLKNVVGKNVSEVIPGIQQADPELFEIYGRVASTGVPERFETYVSGLEMWFSIAVYSPKKEYFVAVFDVITERKRAEEALRQSEQRYRQLFNQMVEGVLLLEAIYDENGKPCDFRHVEVNPACERQNGVPRDKILGRTVREVFPDLEPSWIETYGRVVETGEAVQFENFAQTVQKWFDMSLFRTGPGKICAVFTDITERKRAEAERELLSTAIEQAAETVVVTDREGTIQYVNPAFTRVSGYTRAEAIGQNPRVLKSGKHSAEFYQGLWGRLTAGKLWQGQFTNRRKDGTLYLEEATIAPVRNSSGEITSYIAIKYDITDKKRAEEALRENEQLLRIFVRHAPAAIAMLDTNMRYLVVSDRWKADYRLGDRDIRGLSHYEVFPEMPERWKESYRHSLAGAVERCEEDQFPRPDGSLDWLSWEVRPWLKADDSIGGIIIFSELITERVKAKEALRESEARLRALGDNLPEGAIYRYCQNGDGKQRLDFISAGIEHLTGVPQVEVAFDVMAALRTIVPEDFERMKAAMAVSQERLTQFEIEVRHIHRKTGELRWSLLRSTPFRLPDGTTVWDGFEFDITAMKQIEDSLRQAESRERARAAEIEALMDAVPVGIVRSDDPEGRTMRGNRAAYDMFRRPLGSNLSKSGPENEAPRNYLGMKGGKEIPLADLPMRKAPATGQAVRDFEMDFLFEDGATVNVLSNAVPVLDEAGRPRGAIGTYVDITGRKLAEKALVESELRYRQLFERSESAVGLYEIVYDAQGNPCDFRFLDVNPAWERLIGFTRSQALGRRALELTPGLEDYWIKLYGKVAETGEPASFEHYAQHLGRYFAGTAYTPRPHQVAVTFMDVTDRMRAEKAIREINVELEKRVRSRTAALETANRELEAFAHSVSHDLRAPLRGIDGWSQALLEDCRERLDEQGRKYLDRVRSEAQRMGRLIDDLLHLSRLGRSEMVLGAVDLSALAETIVARLKEANPDRTIEFIVAPQLSCTGDARLLEVALTNLLENAVKFTGLSSAAKVEFGRTAYAGAPAFFVRDNGAGFDMAYAKMLFAPFQRLHKASEFPGTGIGLATVQRVIHRHGGRIWAEAQVGVGATFYFTFGE